MVCSSVRLLHANENYRLSSNSDDARCSPTSNCDNTRILLKHNDKTSTSWTRHGSRSTSPRTALSSPCKQRVTCHHSHDFLLLGSAVSRCSSSVIACFSMLELSMFSKCHSILYSVSLTTRTFASGIQSNEVVGSAVFKSRICRSLLPPDQVRWQFFVGVERRRVLHPSGVAALNALHPAVSLSWRPVNIDTRFGASSVSPQDEIGTFLLGPSMSSGTAKRVEPHLDGQLVDDLQKVRSGDCVLGARHHHVVGVELCQRVASRAGVPCCRATT